MIPVAKIEEILTETVQIIALEFVGLETIPTGNGFILRIFVDKPGGVNLDDCAKASKRISAALEVAKAIDGKYTIEVSSPGLDRPLFKLDDFNKYVGFEVNIKLNTPIEGRKNFKGKLISVVDETILIKVDGSDYELLYPNIKMAKLVPKI